MITRLNRNLNGSGMLIDKEGDYVYYDDHIQEITAMQEENKRLKLVWRPFKDEEEKGKYKNWVVRWKKGAIYLYQLRRIKAGEEDLFNHFEMTATPTDEKSWQPCGILEEQ